MIMSWMIDLNIATHHAVWFGGTFFYNPGCRRAVRRIRSRGGDTNSTHLYQVCCFCLHVRSGFPKTLARCSPGGFRSILAMRCTQHRILIDSDRRKTLLLSKALFPVYTRYAVMIDLNTATHHTVWFGGTFFSNAGCRRAVRRIRSSGGDTNSTHLCQVCCFCLHVRSGFSKTLASCSPGGFRSILAMKCKQHRLLIESGRRTIWAAG